MSVEFKAEFDEEVNSILAEYSDESNKKLDKTEVVKERKQKVARNISKEVTIIIPAHSVPSFKPAKTFVDSVKEK